MLLEYFRSYEAWAGTRHLRRNLIVSILGVFLLLLPVPVSIGEERSLSPERFMAFLKALEGPWEGQATMTPVGPRPYDITFRRTASASLEGQAQPSAAATHYWTFYQEEKAPKLRFLSTFAGNRKPLFLRASAEGDGAMIFRASQPQFLEVRVKPLPRTLTIRIFLRGEPHVEIHLTRVLSQSFSF